MITEDVDADDMQRAMLEESVVEFILCSRMKSSTAAPPQGIALYALPPTLIVFLDSADIQSVSLSRLLKPALKLSVDDDIETNQTVIFLQFPFNSINNSAKFEFELDAIAGYQRIFWNAHPPAAAA